MNAPVVTRVPRLRLRVLVCGSRTWTDEAPIRARLSRFAPGSVVIHGACGLDAAEVLDPKRMRGADGIAHRVAVELGLAPAPYPAAWRRYGRRAGPLRNERMLAEELPHGIDLGLAWSIGSSPGTADMVRRLRAAGVHVELVEVP